MLLRRLVRRRQMLDRDMMLPVSSWTNMSLRPPAANPQTPPSGVPADCRVSEVRVCQPIWYQPVFLNPEWGDQVTMDDGRRSRIGFCRFFAP